MSGSVREAGIERAVSKHANAAGWLVIKIQSTNFRGLPDRLFIRDGRCVFIEFKAPGKKPKPIQRLTHNIIASRGVDVYVIDNIDAGLELFK